MSLTISCGRSTDHRAATRPHPGELDGTTAVLSANEVSVRLFEGSLALTNPIRQQDQSVYIALADVPAFFSAFSLTFPAEQGTNRTW